MEYIHNVHASQYEFHNQQNTNGLLNQSMEMRTRSWIQEHQHQAQQSNQPTGAQMDQALFYGQQQQHQQLQHQHQHQPQQNQQPQQQHQSINQQSNHQSVSFNQQSNSPWLNQQTQQLQQHYQRPQSQQESYQQTQHQQPQHQQQHQQPQQLYQHQSTLQWNQLDSFNLNRIIDQSIVNHDLLINSFQSQLINQQPQHQHQHQQQVPLFPNLNNRPRHDLLYYKQLQEQESQQFYNQQQQNHQQNHQQPQQPQQQPKPLPNKVLFKFILNLTKPEAEQYLVQIAQTPALSTRIRLVENERKNLTINLIETLHPTQVNQFQQPPEEYVFVSIELIIVKSAEAKKTDEAQEEDCLHVEEIEDEVEVVEEENKNAEDRARKVAEIQEDCVRVEEIDGKVEDKQAKLTRPSILIFSSSKDKKQVNGEKIVAEENAEKNAETNIETNVETNDETQNVEDTAPDSQILQTFSDQDVEFNDQSNTTASIELDETVDGEPKGEHLKVNKPERPSSPEALIIQNILPDSSSSPLLCTEDMPISPFLDQIKIPLGSIDPIETTTNEKSVQLDQIVGSSQVESSGTETISDSDATEIDNETVNETTVSESNMKRTRTSTTSSTVSISVPKKRKIKVESSKSPLQSTSSSTPKRQIKKKSSSSKASPQRSKKHYHQSHLDLSSIIQPRVSTTKRLTRSSTASLVQKQKQQQQPKRIGTRVQQSSKSNKLKRK